jgi:DNA sulfur modification protein DndD
LFDENWIAVNFESIHHEYAEKVSQLSIERRKLQSEFDTQKGIKQGELKARAELLNNAIPLPIGIPSKAHMEEMLNDEICKVCNREAKKNSEPYKFMIKRLEAYLTSQAHKDKEEATSTEDFLFKNDYTNRLVNLSVSHEDNLKNLRGVRTRIKELFKFNEARKKDIEELNEQLEKEKTEREKILGNSSIAEEKLVDVLKNYNAWQNDLKQRNKDQLDYNTRLKVVMADLKTKKEEKDTIDLKSANQFLIKTRAILRDIETIFKDTKEMKFDEFISKLQTKSNSFFSKINIESFTGTIVFTKRTRQDKTIVEY